MQRTRKIPQGLRQCVTRTSRSITRRPGRSSSAVISPPRVCSKEIEYDVIRRLQSVIFGCVLEHARWGGDGRRPRIGHGGGLPLLVRDYMCGNGFQLPESLRRRFVEACAETEKGDRNPFNGRIDDHYENRASPTPFSHLESRDGCILKGRRECDETSHSRESLETDIEYQDQLMLLHAVIATRSYRGQTLKRDTQALDMPKAPLQRGWLMGVFFFSPDTGNAWGGGRGCAAAMC